MVKAFFLADINNTVGTPNVCFFPALPANSSASNYGVYHRMRHADQKYCLSGSNYAPKNGRLVNRVKTIKERKIFVLPLKITVITHTAHSDDPNTFFYNGLAIQLLNNREVICPFYMEMHLDLFSLNLLRMDRFRYRPREDGL